VGGRDRAPRANGIEVLKYAVRSNPDIAVVILTAYGTLDTTIEAVKEGAYDYLTKPFKTQEIVILAKRANQRALLIEDNRELRKNLRDTYRDLELLKTVATSNNPEVMNGWLGRIEKLKFMDVLQTHEAEVLKEKMLKGYARG
jgi:DNA-binding NtrC family response regulator